MKIFPRPRLLWLCLGLVLASAPAPPAAAAPEALATPAPAPGSYPAEAAPKVSPDAPPSATLQPFVDTHLGIILAPVGAPAFAQPEVLVSLKAGYADGLAAAPPARQPAYRLAQIVCDALLNAMTERQKATAAPRGALATRSSEAEQPPGGWEAVNKARDRDAFFTEG